MNADSPNLPPPPSNLRIRSLIVEHDDDLHGLAVRQMAGEKANQSLNPTALVHEAVGQMLDPDRRFVVEGDSHFLAKATLIMKHIVIDRARQKRTEKRGGDRQRHELTAEPVSREPSLLGLLVLEEELQRLAVADPQAARIVELRTQGFSIDEAAQQLQLPRSTAYNLWSFARAWLAKVYRDAETSDP